MTHERFDALMTDDALELTPAEIIEGWHFCVEFDGLLVSPRCDEFQCCRCPLPYMQIDTAMLSHPVMSQCLVGMS